ncbi:unnamed protein product [Mytilus coruscus]|uniref:Endonuclease/exonuclease/phosphatase domain-containing protein n=1 Tax=Mytilus coruscus TaxID=42192 RepID=A0A6J8DHD5_MYTCO|nr:unnamed protein product [Mytilus coruscus]
MLILAGDVESNPGPANTIDISDQSISIFHCNIRSLRNKLDYISNVIEEFDIIFFSETHLAPFITNEKIALPEFETPIRKDRNSDGGGVIMYYKSNIKIKRRLDLEHDSLEIMWFELKTKLHVILMNITYRSERFSPSNFWSLYDMMLKRALDETNHIICLGDLNKNFLLNLPNCISDILSINGLFNTINDATHFDSRTGSLSLLDPILITDSIQFIDSGIIPINRDISDHEDDIIGLSRMFADDTSIGHTAPDETTLQSMINIDLQNINSWANDWLVRFNPNKTNIMLFSNKN